MNSFALISLACISIVHATVTPTAPGPGQTFNEGSDCPIQWNLDTTGKWTSFNIDLKSGSNTAMQLVTNVASGLDGTKGATSYSWKCPKVTPNSAIYFYEFSQAGESTTWTTRFTIASASGATTPPTESTQPDGKKIPWGTGQLANGASPSPSAGSTTSNVSSPAANTSTTTMNTTASTTGAVTTPINTTTTGTTGSTTSGTTGTSTSSSATSPKSGSTSHTVSTPANTSGTTNTTANLPTTSGSSSLYKAFSRSSALVTLVSIIMALSA